MNFERDRFPEMLSLARAVYLEINFSSSKRHEVVLPKFPPEIYFDPVPALF